MTLEIHEHDTVKLLKEVDGVPAGTIGAVVSEYPATALVEFSDPSDERDLFEDLVSVPYEHLSLVQSSAETAR